MGKGILMVLCGVALMASTACTSSVMRITSNPEGAKVFAVDHNGWFWAGPQPDQRGWTYKCIAPCDITYTNDIYVKVKWDDGEESRYIYIGYWDEGTRNFVKPTAASRARDDRTARCQRPCTQQKDRCIMDCANKWIPRAGDDSAPLQHQACQNECNAEANSCYDNCN